MVLVLGAGCSVEEPTDLPLSGDFAEDCHRRLCADGVLHDNEVSDHRDLSAVADAVSLKTGRQRDFVDRFPIGDFHGARANEGYKIMVALLLEGALTDAMTLNFDLAAPHALSDSGWFHVSETIIPEAGSTFLSLQHTNTLIPSGDWGLVDRCPLLPFQQYEGR